MTDTQLTWIGIIGQGVPILTGLYLVTVGNWMITRKDRGIKTPKPNAVEHNFCTINRQEILEQTFSESEDNSKAVKRFEKLLLARSFRYFRFTEGNLIGYGIGLKKWSDEEIKQMGWVFTNYTDDYKLYNSMYDSITSTLLEQEKQQ